MGVVNPIKLLGLSLLIWLFFYMQIPAKYLYTGGVLFPILTLVLFITSFVLGIKSLKRVSVKTIEKPSSKKLKQIIHVLFFIGLIGVFLKIYVGVFKSEIFVANDVFEQRLENMGKELTGGMVGVFASLLFPFSYVALLMVIYNYKIFNRFFLFVVLLFGSYPFVETIFMGGRTIIALLGTTLLFVLFASYYKNSKAPLYKFKLARIRIIDLPKVLFKKQVIVPLVLIGILFTSYSVSVVNKRLTRFGYGNRTLTVWEKKDYQWVKFNEDFKYKYFNETKEEQAKMIGLYSLKHYFAHGLIEYVRLVNHLDKTTGYYYGQYEFNVFFKFFKAFGVPLKSTKQLQSIVKRKAVYTSFFGPFYIDFGVFGAFIMFFWGRFIKRVYVYSKRGHTQYVVFYGYLATIIITSMFINFILGSSSYYLFAFFTCLLMFKYWPENLMLKVRR